MKYSNAINIEIAASKKTDLSPNLSKKNPAIRGPTNHAMLSNAYNNPPARFNSLAGVLSLNSIFTALDCKENKNVKIIEKPKNITKIFVANIPNKMTKSELRVNSKSTFL